MFQDGDGEEAKRVRKISGLDRVYSTKRLREKYSKKSHIIRFSRIQKGRVCCLFLVNIFCIR